MARGPVREPYADLTIFNTADGWYLLLLIMKQQPSASKLFLSYGKFSISFSCPSLIIHILEVSTPLQQNIISKTPKTIPERN